MAAYTPTLHLISCLRGAFGSRAFTASEALAIGVDSRRLRYLATRGHIARLHRGTYCVSENSRLSAAVLEACAFVTDHGIRPIIGGSFAAQIWGLDGNQGRPLIWIPPGSSLRRGLRGDVIVRSGTIKDDLVASWADHSMTSPLRTSIDVACASKESGSIAWLLCQGMRRDLEWRITRSVPSRLSGHDLAFMIGDPEQRRAMTAALGSACDEHHGRGIALVKRLALLLDPRLESALECLSWLRFQAAGIPLPTPQEWIRGASGRSHRVDFRWRGVIGEADGALKYATAEDLWKEKRRQEDLERAGFIVVRWTWAEITHDPMGVIDRLLQAFSRAQL